MRLRRCRSWRAAEARSAPGRICTRAEPSAKWRPTSAAGVTFVSLREPDYPLRLAMIDDAPPLIAVRGELALWRSRRWRSWGAQCIGGGIKFAERLARELAKRVLVVASRVALRQSMPPAHRGSLTTGTVAAIAGGHQQHLPARAHRQLADALPEKRRRALGNAARPTSRAAETFPAATV